LKDPSGVVENPEDYEEFKDYPLEALLYLENLINRGRLEARSRPAIRAYELAVIKSIIVKDILPLSEVMSGNVVVSREEARSEEKKDSFEEKLKQFLSPVAYKALKEAKRFTKEGREVFQVEEDTFNTFREEFEKLKKNLPEVEFEVQKKKDQRKSTTSLF